MKASHFLQRGSKYTVRLDIVVVLSKCYAVMVNKVLPAKSLRIVHYKSVATGSKNKVDHKDSHLEAGVSKN